MSAHVLLNLLNELRKRDKMGGLPSILSLFRSELNKFNKTREQMLDSIYHMTLRLLYNLISAVKSIINLSLCTQRCYGHQNVSPKICGLSILLHGIISLPEVTSYDKYS